jgi:ABC-type sugar transport system substrate-binding protein
MAQESGRYVVDAAARILDVWQLFSGDREVIGLSEIANELGIVKSSAFRFLRTLETKGYIERGPDGHGYRKRRRHRIGLLSLASTLPFVAEVEQGIVVETRRHGIQLDVRHGEFDPVKTLKGVEELLAGGVELLLAYNADEHLSHVIADRCVQRNVPIFAITFPVPGAGLFGVNNYRAGLTGGNGLGQEIQRRWRGKMDLLVVLDIPGNSPAQQVRITGMLEGLRSQIPFDGRVLHLHIDRRQRTSEALMTDLLQSERACMRIAVLCYNDATAIGADDAVVAAKRQSQAMILSQGATEPVRKRIGQARSAIRVAVAHFPERFGSKLIPVVQRVLSGESVAGPVYIEPALLTSANVRQYSSLAASI